MLHTLHVDLSATSVHVQSVHGVHGAHIKIISFQGDMLAVTSVQPILSSDMMSY